MDLINITKEDGVVTLQMNRPEKYNAFVKPMAIALQQALDHCAEEETVRCVVLTGSGKAFCAGQDLPEVMDQENGIEMSAIVAEHYNPIIAKIRKLEKPVIAAVNGVAAGAGANIALACDIVIATASASFIQAFSKIGLIPDSGGTFFLPRLIGFQKASALMMLGDKISAEEAERLGMIYAFYPDDTFATEVKRCANKLAKMPTKGLGFTKRALNLSLNNNLEKQLSIEEHLQTEAGFTEDFGEGVNAFIEKRKPNFIGK